MCPKSSAVSSWVKYAREVSTGRNFSTKINLSRLALPALYVFLIVVTMLISLRTPGGAYYRIFGVDPLGVGVGMVSEGAIFYATLVLFGTFWWFYIGTIGWKSRERSVTRPSAALGALLSLFTAVVGFGMTKDVFYQDLKDGALSPGAFVQYACIGMLCVGAVLVTIYSTIAAFCGEKNQLTLVSRHYRPSMCAHFQGAANSHLF